MKDAYWFKHDSNASRTMKLMQIKAIYGLEGLGIFWSIIEVLREQNFYRWSEKEINILAKVIDCDQQKLTNFIADCKRIGLLAFDSEFMASDRLKKDMKTWDSKKKNRTKHERNTNETRTELDNKRREEKSKGEESISETAFLAFHQAYPGIKKYITTELANFKKTTKDWKVVLPLLLPAIQVQIASRKGKDWNPEWKSFSNWVSARCWEEIPSSASANVEMSVVPGITAKQWDKMTFAEKAKAQGVPYI
jgi:hypothetical protein